MPNAAAEVQEECESGSEQHDLADRRSKYTLYGGIGVRSGSCRHQPHDQADGRYTQKYAGDTISD
jgi:hypothetical protein